jgi:SAM-dependent methyltransferase
VSNLLPRLEFTLQSLYRSALRCPHCRSAATERIARKHLTVRVRRCSECLLCFTDPLYESSVLGRLYDAAYTAEGSTTSLPAPAELAALVRDGFAGSDKDFRDRIERLRALAQGPRLLELGSSWGYFVHQARAGGFDAVGVEIGRARREFGVRELGVPLVAELAELESRRFDVVYTSHVLEHFTDLTTIFDELHARLAPGGLLALEVPHFDFAGRGRAALASIGAVHPLGFTPEFFARNLPRHGFELAGFFDAWSDVPDRPRERSTGDVVIALARRTPGES